MPHKKSRDKNKQDLPQVPENQKVEYSEELADAEDREAQARSKEAEQRQENRVNTNKI
ncbi:YfhD family protein [Evansella halocellulosilytica]|uniref:YfhD family protein n=1 Tax=Evansella halocellulosilytica TaxID=2011013 RepID=UPI000BB75A02|nr:YfhD family protein [Evansella halocellulosilytica]